MSTRSSADSARPAGRAIPDLPLRVVLVAIGGAAGAVLRGLTEILCRELLLWPTWIGTLGVNLTGAFLIGFAIVRLDPGFPRIEDAAELAGDLPGLERRRRLAASLFVTGGLGALTTFSSFGIESAELIQQGRSLEALLSVVTSVGVGLGAVALGARAGQLRPASAD